MRQALLVEIGVEELPNSHLKLAIETLKRSIPGALQNLRLGFGGLRIYGTPRRLVIDIQGLDTQQQSQKIQLVGPAKSVALDPKGKPTPAYFGFLKSQKALEKQASFREIPSKKGEYLVIERQNPSKPTRVLLKGFISGQLTGIPFPRKMHWGTSLEFSRPIRWLLVFHGGNRVSLTIGGVQAENITYAHRFLHPKPIRVKSIEGYFKTIRKWGILLDPEERQTKIWERLKKESPGLDIENYRDLIEEVANLVEIPYFLKGKLSKHFLELPEEVLIASMSKYQRIFALREKNGKLKSSFLAVLNGKPAKLDSVRRHYEWVLNARLVDSHYFFNEDRKTGLLSHLGGLKQVKFHEQLGSFYDRSFRLEKLCQWIVENQLHSNDQTLIKIVMQAAVNSKCDLLTRMVYEFPSLQGIMGYYYALSDPQLQREHSKDHLVRIATAIKEQYDPKGAGQPIPATLEGSILSLSDRLITLVGFFGIGIYPTGSEDPLSLKRAAIGIVRILMEKKLPLSIDNLIDRSILSYSSQVVPNSPSLGHHEDLRQKLSSFLRERLVTQLEESFQSSELVEAVVSVGVSNVADIVERLRQLKKIYHEPYFQQAAKVQERTQNIVKGIPEAIDHTQVRGELLTEEPEKQLWSSFQACRDQIESMIQKKDYQKATQCYGESFFDLIHQFFDKVLVNTENPNVRKNRLRLCSEIYHLYADRVADLSKVRVN